MLYFLTRGQHMYTVRVFKQYVDANYLQIVPHEELAAQQFSPEDVAIFCDIDRCNDEELEELKKSYANVLKTGCRILNDPNKVMRRYQLLKGLHADSTNDFRVYRPHELPPKEELRFPVFLRNELEHNGPDTELMLTWGELKEALINEPPSNPLVCEFIDTATKGLYHKYGAFVLEGRIIPRHFFLSDVWNVKSASGDILHSQKLEIDYVTQNPHAHELLRIAAYANVEFGRIDYAITEKGIQVFEINTNPTIIDRKDIIEGNPRHFITNRFIQTLAKEFKNLNLATHYE
jgi:hypothetical protein